ncbi:MAG: transcription/translation regulatory transformer protein RfaH [Thiotrichales bacterium]
MSRWYVIHTKPRQEDVAEGNLKRQGFEVFLPRCEQQKRRRGKWKGVIEPVFPRYLFIHLTFGDQNVSTIRSTRGVSGLVRFGEQPTAVPEDFMRSLLMASDPDSGLYRVGVEVFKPGDAIQVIDGALAGLQGIFKAESGDERVSILLNLLGREHSIEVERDQIMPVG